jgi:cytochrome c55X
MRRTTVLLGLLMAWNVVAATEPSAARQKELIHLVRQDCGSCHGMQLTGGLGLPLTPETLKERPFEGMVATVYYGRPGTAMPPWQSIITEKEAEWIVQQLMAGFPEDRR